jgi:CspA family cold shock protein
MLPVGGLAWSDDYDAFPEKLVRLRHACGHGVRGRDYLKSFQEKAVMTIGQVKFFNTTKGFGFIAPEGGGKDVFVHMTAVQAAGLRGLNEGQRVSFDVEADKRGPKAVNLKLV